MKYTENTLNILTTKTIKGIGDAWINKNLQEPLPYEQIIEILEKEKKVKEEISEEKFLFIRENIKKIIDKLDNYCDGITSIGDNNFPQWRGKVKASDQPNVLFYRGDLGLLSKSNKNIAVIGVLNPDPETEVDERKIVHQLAKQNAVIVSGLALGCDSIAHDQTIKSDGVTVAILPSPLNNIQPKQNKELADEIVNTGGLLITEYYDIPKSAQDLSGRYIKRDRLQALFSDVVLLSASYTPDSKDPNNGKIDSGSRHAMEKAKEYDIPRAVIYNEKYKLNPKYDLNRKIIETDKNTIIVDPTNVGSTIDKLFSDFASHNLDFLSEPTLNEEKNSNEFLTDITKSGIILSKNKYKFTIPCDQEIAEYICQLLKYFLNKKTYSATIHNDIGFLKFFSDIEKKNYMMAIKIIEINSEAKKLEFLEFFRY